MELYEIIEKLEAHCAHPVQENALKEPLNKLRECLDNQESQVQLLKEEGRLLHIGIIGQVKAGKSSFLNALLFDGKDFLPHAATPMTAALTRLEYAEKLRSEFDFYTPKEWQAFENLYQEYETIKRQQAEASAIQAQAGNQRQGLLNRVNRGSIPNRLLKNSPILARSPQIPIRSWIEDARP